MMDSSMQYYMHFNWFEWLEMGLFMLFAFFVLLFFVRLFVFTPVANGNKKKDIFTCQIQSWKEVPEFLLLTLSLPLQLLWEIAQFPLYTLWHEGDWSYIFYGLAHCTLGDLLILISTFWIVSILNNSRYWIFSPSLLNIALFTVFGLGYTIYSEIVNTRIKGTWGYTELMPIVPVIEVGGMPFMQWLLIPPILIWLMHLINPIRAS
ncbi:MAG: hypothetical protein RQ982_08880, partial [Gammaproteobacteria bacterium]|nr:hypothetical protein [Gammaproteobacteria bacterium]